MNKQQLAAKIWESANQMRSKIEANEYKDYILGFIFYKYLSDKLVRFAKSQDFSDEDLRALSEEDPETVEHIKSNIGYFIAYKHLFSTWIDPKSDFEVSHVRDALSAFGRLIHPNHKRLFEGIFKTLETGLSKLGETDAKRTKAISDLLQLIKDIPMDGRQGYDVLGFIYEYLIGKFAANAGKKAGEFYTPHEVSVLMSEIIAHHVKDKETIQIYDSTSGSGSLLLNIGQSIAKHMADKGSIKYYAQELKEPTYNLTRMNLVMRDILPTNIVTRNADTLEDDWPFFDDQDPVNTYNPLYLDAVVSNPPYSQKWDPQHKESDPRFSRFGLAPKSKADYAFLLHDLYHLKPDGIMAIILPHGVLFRVGEEGAIRRNLIENDHLETIIGLPSKIFFGTSISTTILVLRQKRERNDVLIVDASKGFTKEGKHNKLRASDIKKICDTVIQRVTIPQYSRVVTKAEIRDKDYTLNIPRYVNSSEPAERWDLYASMFGGIPQSELDLLAEYWEAFPSLRSALFKEDATPYVQPHVDDLTPAIRQHLEVQALKEKFSAAFANFNSWLRRELIDQMLTVPVSRQESLIGVDIFARLKSLPLIDPYHAYQCLDDHWQQIAVDLEILQTEGLDASRVLEPNMVEKTKDGKKVEVQEGWKGRILPFGLVQKVHHKNELDALKEKEARLNEITALLEETLEELSDEEKDGDIVNEQGDKFVPAAVAKEAKQLKAEAKIAGKFDPESYEAKIIQAAEWIAEEKALKAKIKAEAAVLHLATKTTIEGLTEAQVHELLELKWIIPLSESLHYLPSRKIQVLETKLENLVEKYRITYADTAREIGQIEAELAGMINQLEGSEYDMKGLSELNRLLEGKNLATLKQAMLEKMLPISGTTIPRVRFKAFSEPWGEKALHQLADRYDNLRIPISARNRVPGKTPYYGANGIQGYVQGHTHDGEFILVAEDGANDVRNYPVQYVSGQVWVNNHAHVLQAKKGLADNLFLKYAFSQLNVEAFLVGGGRSKLNAETMMKMELCVPSTDTEQQNLGYFFQQLDELISKHAMQLTKLKNIRAACLEKMFV